MFKVGDKVDWLGWRGTVEEVNMVGGPEDIIVCGEVGDLWAFYKDGRYLKEQEPSLVLIERPKKKIKKTISQWVNVYPNGYIKAHDTKEKANKFASNIRIACVELTGEYEVEE